MSFMKHITNSILPAASGAGVGFLAGGLPGAAIGALAGGGLGFMSSKQAAAQNKANQKAVNAANAYDMYTWDLANAYNNPVAQMQRLKDAGLNPNLVYGGGNVTGNTVGVAGSNGVASQAVADQVGLASQIAQQGLQIQQAQANVANTKASTAYTKTQNENLQNFLNNKGHSTYNKPTEIEALFNGLFGKSASKPNGENRGLTERAYGYLTRPSTKDDTNYFRKAAEWVGDTAWKFFHK